MEEEAVEDVQDLGSAQALREVVVAEGLLLGEVTEEQLVLEVAGILAVGCIAHVARDLAHSTVPGCVKDHTGREGGAEVASLRMR